MKIGNRQWASGNNKKAEIFAFALCALLFVFSYPVEGQEPKKKSGDWVFSRLMQLKTTGTA